MGIIANQMLADGLYLFIENWKAGTPARKKPAAHDGGANETERKGPGQPK